RQAQAAVRAAEARLAGEQKSLADLTLRAPVSAQVDLIAAEAGSRVNAGMPLLTLLANADPYVRVYVPQSKVASLSVGTVLEIRVEGLSKPLHGRVRNVRSQPAYTPYFALSERDRARLMHLTDIVLTDVPAGLASGLAVEVLLPDDASAQGSKP
ncbi:MAG: HlyD family efflux transporter periplasmic adaptor subunit, partial [Saccharospirillaceae bacterium]|nr:HlyD family efflux transporter periplasmic adaptor subunit [Saccharospirillaceae bacterium]